MNVAPVLEQVERLKVAGFKTAAAVAEKKASLVRRLAMAYEHYRYVTKEQIAEFNKKLKANTERPASQSERDSMSNRSYHVATHVADQLKFETVADYTGTPPANVVEKVIKATELGIFDAFTVATVSPVATREKYIDPIVFGTIKGCDDHFFIGEWGDDVSIADILGPNAG